MAQEILQGKLKITAALHVETGLHIGGSSDFAPIGAVDSPFIRDAFTKEPIIPGSSLKGKIRSLLRRQEGVTDMDKESPVIQRLFGTAGDIMLPARLQFFDIRMNRDSVTVLEQADTDTYLGEVKFENSINPVTGEANPRQIERVPAGAVFDFQLVYNVVDAKRLTEDMTKLADGLHLLQWDYLGGHGSRGYGRVRFTDWQVVSFSHAGDEMASEVLSLLKEV